MAPRTSISHPLRVDWLPTPWLGRVGLTFAPGKHQEGTLTGSWARDLDADLARLRDHYSASRLVCLLEDAELSALRIPALGASAAALGMSFHRLPIPDFSTPPDPAVLRKTVADIVGWAAMGENVVIHCKGGLGRAGTVGGCVLRAAGLGIEDTLEALKDARGLGCPETAAQAAFIRDFTSGPPSRESRVAGAVLGAAVGDALGHPTEFILSFADIRRRYPPAGVTGYELWWEDAGQRFAPYTDDTQMAEIVLRALVAHGGRAADLEAVMHEIANGFAHWADHPQGGHRAPGNACMAGSRRIRDGVSWREAGGATAGGCGSVMRAYPFGLLLSPDLELVEHWAVEHSRMTHRDPIALAACAALAVGVALELEDTPPERTRAMMIKAAGRHDARTAAMAEQAVAEADSGVEPQVTLQRLEGWAAHEAIAAAMYVVARHGSDLQAALLEAANTPGDSDSIATLAGALLGARLGLEALPTAWIRDLERSQELRTLARSAAAVGSGPEGLT